MYSYEPRETNKGKLDELEPGEIVEDTKYIATTKSFNYAGLGKKRRGYEISPSSRTMKKQGQDSKFTSTTESFSYADLGKSKRPDYRASCSSPTMEYEERRILIKYLPEDAPLDNLTNAVSFHISQALRLSLRFTKASYGKGYVEMMDPNGVLAGRVWLAPKQSSSNDPYGRRRCQGYGYVDLLDTSPVELLTAVSILNETFCKVPLRVADVHGRVVAAKDLTCLVVKEERVDDENCFEGSIREDGRNKALANRAPLSTSDYANVQHKPRFEKVKTLQNRWAPSTRPSKRIWEG